MGGSAEAPGELLESIPTRARPSDPCEVDTSKVPRSVASAELGDIPANIAAFAPPLSPKSAGSLADLP